MGWWLVGVMGVVVWGNWLVVGLGDGGWSRGMGLEGEGVWLPVQKGLFCNGGGSGGGVGRSRCG